MMIEWPAVSFPLVLTLNEPKTLGIEIQTLTLTRDERLRLVCSAFSSEVRVPPQRILGQTPRGVSLELGAKNFHHAKAEEFLIIEEFTERREGESGRQKITGRVSKVSLLRPVVDKKPTVGDILFTAGLTADAPPHFIVEWISNLPRKPALAAPGRTPEGSAPDNICFEVYAPGLSKICIGALTEEDIPKGEIAANPGFIQYWGDESGLPDEEIRQRVRYALEFLFGCGLGVLGSSKYGKFDQLLSTEISEAHISTGHHAPSPPSELFLLGGEINKELFAQFIQNYLNHEKIYHLNGAIWLFLHAQNAPLEMRAGYVGTAFEMIRTEHDKRPQNKRSSKLLPKPQWKRLSRRIYAVLDELIKDEDWRAFKAPLQKIKVFWGSRNTKSGAKRNEKFIERLALSCGDIEKNALQARNQAVHGNRLALAKKEQTRQQNQALRTLFARVVFSILKVDMKYRDYSSLGHPLRSLAALQGEDSPVAKD